MKKREVSNQCKKCIGKQDKCNKSFKKFRQKETEKMKFMALFCGNQKPCPNGY